MVFYQYLISLVVMVCCRRAVWPGVQKKSNKQLQQNKKQLKLSVCVYEHAGLVAANSFYCFPYCFVVLLFVCLGMCSARSEFWIRLGRSLSV